MEKLFYETVEKVKEVAQVASKKADELMERSRLLLLKGKCESKLSDAYEKLGRSVYQGEIADVDITLLKKDLFAQIDELNKKLSETMERMENMKENHDESR